MLYYLNTKVSRVLYFIGMGRKKPKPIVTSLSFL